MNLPHRTALFAAAVCALSAALPTQAAEAMRVVRDTATGELRGPTAAEALAFEKTEAAMRAAQAAARGAAPAKATGPVEIRYPDGTVETKLGEDTMLYSVVSSSSDGALRFDCLPARQAEQFTLTGGRKAPVSAAAAKTTATATLTGKDGHAHP